MKSTQDLKNILDKVEKFQNEIDSLKETLKSLIEDEHTEKLLNPKEYEKRKRRERNKRFYQKNKKKHW